MSESTLNRRQILKLSTALLLPAPLRGGVKNSDDNPMEGERAPAGYRGDEPDRAHELLRGGQRELSFRTPPERSRLVVIGGGMSGLLTCYLLRKYDPILLEQSSRFGGNSKGGTWNGIRFSYGAAYIGKPAARTTASQLLHELRLFGKEKRSEDPVAVNDRLYNHFWRSGTSADDAPYFQKWETHLRQVSEGKGEWPYPELPYETRDPAVLAKYDSLSLGGHLQRILGGNIPKILKAAVDHYCLSSLGAPSDEVSAAAGLNFLAGEISGILALPGGNSAITEKLYRTLSLRNASRLRSQSVVVRVEAKESSVEIQYLDSRGVPRRLLADVAVLSCPKFVVKHILAGIEESRREAINQLEYRPYLVGTVHLRGKFPKLPYYDVELLTEPVPQTAPFTTDVVLSSFSQPSNGRLVLSFYCPFASDWRSSLFSSDPKPWADNLKRKTQLFLKAAGVHSYETIETRFARFGHALPVAKPGFYQSGLVEQLRAPHKDRVLFAEQDNWSLPSFETCLFEAERASRMAQSLIG